MLQDLIKRKPDLVIRSDHRRLPCVIHVELNDGVVNTVRQVVDPDDRSQVGAFVVADHADVLGAIFGGTLAPETVTLQFAIFALDATTLGIMLHAIVTPADTAVVFASFVVASMVATLAWVPGGLGTFEGTCVAMLHVHGVAIEPALAATLLARGFTFWLPMAPGLAIARREMVRGAAGAGSRVGTETP